MANIKAMEAKLKRMEENVERLRQKFGNCSDKNEKYRHKCWKDWNKAQKDYTEYSNSYYQAKQEEDYNQSQREKALKERELRQSQQRTQKVRSHKESAYNPPANLTEHRNIKDNLSPYSVIPTEVGLDGVFGSSLDSDKLEKIQNSMKRNGFFSSKALKVYKYQGLTYLINGHHRLKSAQNIGLSSIPVEYVSKEYLLRYFDSEQQLTTPKKQVKIYR